MSNPESIPVEVLGGIVYLDPFWLDWLTGPGIFLTFPFLTIMAASLVCALLKKPAVKLIERSHTLSSIARSIKERGPSEGISGYLALAAIIMFSICFCGYAVLSQQVS